MVLFVVADAFVFLTGELENVSVDFLGEFEHFLRSFLRGDSFAVVGFGPVVPPQVFEFVRELLVVESCLDAFLVDVFVVDVLVDVEKVVLEEVELDGPFDGCERCLDDDRVVAVLVLKERGCVEQSTGFPEL
jgi:hypothetical protein